MILEIADLVHHLLINGETSGCIDDYHIVAVGLSLLAVSYTHLFMVNKNALPKDIRKKLGI